MPKLNEGGNARNDIKKKVAQPKGMVEIRLTSLRRLWSSSGFWHYVCLLLTVLFRC